MRRKKKAKYNILPDPIYNNITVAKFINQVMRRGKKTIAQKIVYGSFDIIKEKTKKEPLEVFELAISNVKPSLEVKSKRIGGATYQVPQQVPEARGKTLAMRWLIQTAKSRKGKTMKEKLAEELILASKQKGAAIKKKEDTHRMAEANRAFAHFA
ncbi:MAG: 30S ribosomal protein S7 [Patescibacteria group bacterium]|nr:30S ribosomal protein S7 [Patescibacteria group bacterium]